MIYNNLAQLKQDLAPEGRIIALDLGTKTIGVAISDLSRTISNPKLTINRRGNRQDFLILEKIINDNKVLAVVIGLPLNMNDSESQMSNFVRRFADSFDQFLPKIKIIFFDERLSTFISDDLIKEAGARRKRNQLIDQIAASFILQSFLDELRKS